MLSHADLCFRLDLISSALYFGDVLLETECLLERHDNQSKAKTDTLLVPLKPGQSAQAS